MRSMAGRQEGKSHPGTIIDQAIVDMIVFTLHPRSAASTVVADIGAGHGPCILTVALQRRC